MELEQMWACTGSQGQILIPIFYDVTPSDVKDQAGHFGRSFKKHEKDDKVDPSTIQQWRRILRKIGEIKGYEPQKVNEGHESSLVEIIVTRVRELLKKDEQVLPDKLVGIDLHVQEMMRKLGVVYRDGQANKVCGEDVRVIGICGMRGVGKTTLAKVVYNKIRELFNERSLLENMEPKEVVSSQERLIASLQNRKHEALNSYNEGIKTMESLFTNMKVLIVLDDVREEEQIKALAGKLTWFGRGSRIIVTTNRKNVLNHFDEGTVQVHNVKPMRDDHALQLFRECAFRGDAHQDISAYDSLSIDIVKAIGGLPAAIVLWASCLRRKKKIDTWKETLELVKENQGNQLEAAFQDSYESLDAFTREIFLDIACFFIGKDERIPSYMWKACRYNPSRGIEQLRDMDLLEDGENDELRMHNLLRDYGRKLVKGKGSRKRCRFWDHSDADSIPKGDKRAKHVEGIGLTIEEGSPICFRCEKFRNMFKLRYLRLNRAEIQGNTENLPSYLRWLDLRECRFIPELHDTNLKNLVILDLSRSLVASDPKIWSRIMEVKELKVLNLQGCGLSGASLKFQAPISLEILILEDCTQLSAIGKFISGLKSLKSLNLRNCKGVKQLPQQLHHMEILTELLIDGTDIKKIHIENDSLEHLENLSACRCKKLEDISPIGHLTKLKSLALDGAINWHPKAFDFPPQLERLSLRKCEKLFELPPSIGKLRQLKEMDLSDTGITQLPESVEDLSNLKTLKMERTHLKKFPRVIAKLEKLEEIDFSRCKSLEAQGSCDISGLSSLRILKLSSSIVAGLPWGICNLPCLRTLDVSKCERLQALQKLPSSLVTLRWGSKIMAAPELTDLTNLKELCLNSDEQPEAGSLNQTPDIEWITRLTSLETLELSLPNVTNLPGGIRALTHLWELTLSYMEKLDLTQLPSASSLWTLRLKRCKILEPNFSGLKSLSELELDDCNLAKIDGLKDLRNLEVLKILDCRSITNLNGLEQLGCLRMVQVLSSPQVALPELSERVIVDR
ncbi:hypothetical protein BT93_C1662 [Corymbia citriodora subsp. variegata]|nr:hypothetical protein BT93_C1662 [Corymbia citriodora subsp. variegata]